MRIADMLSSLQLGQKKSETHSLCTPWGEEAAAASKDADYIPLPEYPRPQMERDTDWRILNGWWDYRITSLSGNGLADLPSALLSEDSWTPDGKILVPYSPETALSGVKRKLLPGELLWYRRGLPSAAGRMRTLLHFGAVDQECRVFVNGKEAGYHLGGYLPFTLDITEYLLDEGNVLQVVCRDISDTGYHAIGKQRLKPEGMYYTAQSGIWQSVWIEQVPETYIRDIRTDIDFSRRSVSVRVFVSDGSSCTARLAIPKEEFRPWSPEDPYLYRARLTWSGGCAELLPEGSPAETAEGAPSADSVRIYFAMRSFAVMPDINGTSRFFLNGKPFFFKGILDQGYWPESLMTPPSDEAFVFDIRSVKEAGMNLIRKHCKLEPLRWYYHCDTMGMLVWQDIVNGGETVSKLEVTYLPTVVPAVQTCRGWSARACGRLNPEGRKEHLSEISATIRHLYNVPSLAGWVIFNEGWGQFSTVKITRMVRDLDPSRPIDAASGWYDFGTGDYRSVHNYFRPLEVPKDEFYSEFPRAAVISEYGGLAHPVEGHVYTSRIYGYQTIDDAEQLRKRFADLQSRIDALEEKGLSGAVYTQVSDIEEEINGLLTFNRRVNKLLPEEENA